MNKQFSDKELWQRIQEIRGSYKNPRQLKKLIQLWEDDVDDDTILRAKDLMATAASNYWQEMAKNGESLDDLMPILWENWEEGRFTIQKTENSVQIHCSHCPMASAFREINRPDLGIFFHCDEDFAIVKGFNPEIRFSREHNLMEDQFCDHYYELG